MTKLIAADIKIGQHIVLDNGDLHSKYNGVVTAVTENKFHIKWTPGSTNIYNFNILDYPHLKWSILSSIESIKEKPCHSCNKQNDIGVLVCWNCAVLNP